jgi:hypothetical protein
LDSPGYTVIGARSGVCGRWRTIANGRCSNVITAHQASLPQARRPSGAQPAVCMALNDLTVSPVTATCENGRHQGHVRENEPPGSSPQFWPERRANRKLDYFGASQLWGVGATFTNTRVSRYESDDSCSPDFCRTPFSHATGISSRRWSHKSISPASGNVQEAFQTRV